MPKILVLLGSARKGRAADNVADKLKIELGNHPDFDYEFIDPVGLDLPFFDEPSSPSSIDSGAAEYTNPKGKAWAEKVASSDGYIIVTPEYNHGYPAILKNVIDWVGAKQWRGKPVTFVSYGAASGGIRAVEQLRQVIIELRAIPLHDAVHIPHIYAAFDESGDWLNERQLAAFVPMLTELESFLTDRHGRTARSTARRTAVRA
jgi:NAD(P)H-dependent FMN reductase